MDLEVIVMKAYSVFFKALGLKPHHQIVICVINRTLIDFRRFKELRFQFYVFGDGGVVLSLQVLLNQLEVLLAREPSNRCLKTISIR